MRFIKEHLSASNNYNWTDEFIFDGTPSRRLFDRQNGNQLLFIINLYASQNDKFSEDQVQRVEEMLVNKLPEEIKSEISVLNWLKENGQVFLIRQ
ncbi:MAG TPA: hypothetical protein VGQ04_20415 [Chitinophagaceae bacterium]|jgi:hypothetical protein|nr:hypothetical protein [Chitinophagaceae bacterium]